MGDGQRWQNGSHASPTLPPSSLLSPVDPVYYKNMTEVSGRDPYPWKNASTTSISDITKEVDVLMQVRCGDGRTRFHHAHSRAPWCS